MSSSRDRRRRRSRAALEAAVAEAVSAARRATAEYELGLFHDNNGREAEAIPHYEAALSHGLSGERRAECLAWLASSLSKTGRLEEALERLREAREATGSPELMRFLAGLERRVRTKLALDRSLG
jgi:tetratricopeptide (TPR) repeat protein